MIFVSLYAINLGLVSINLSNYVANPLLHRHDEAIGSFKCWEPKKSNDSSKKAKTKQPTHFNQETKASN